MSDDRQYETFKAHWRDRTIERRFCHLLAEPRCPCLTAAGTFRFVSRHNLGLFLINLCKELPHIVKQEIGLFQSGEVSALWHFSFLYYVVCLSDPAKWRDSCSR
jgi:hypothetical protein